MKQNEPSILFEDSYSLDLLNKFRNITGVKIHDIYERQHSELFEIGNPNKIYSNNFEKDRQKYLKKIVKGADLKGNWIYFPWKNVLVHTVKRNEYYSLRTNRNRNLITTKEQDILHNKSIGILGMSIGLGSAFSIIHQGISNSIFLADDDTLESSNLNRIAAGMLDIGKSKVKIAERKIYELDPYLKLTSFNRITKENLETFLLSEGKRDLVIDAIDDLKMKILLRLTAKKFNIPVLMMTNLGDSVMVDVERYDLNPNLEIFNGKIGNFGSEILERDFDKTEINSIVTRIVGKENTPLKAIESLKKIGVDLVGRPQLSSTVTISGALSAFFARKMFLSEYTKSERIIFKFDSLL